MLHRRFATLALVAALFVAGCGDSSSSNTADPAEVEDLEAEVEDLQSEVRELRRAEECEAVRAEEEAGLRDMDHARRVGVRRGINNC
jgi:outer membrane murein-binding lipoprotein Lpp